MDYAAYWFVGTIALAITAYVIVRAGSIGYFRTKYEHFRRIQREIGGSNGER